MDARQVARAASEAGIRLVRFLWCGNDGTVRAKASSVDGLEGRIRAGIGVTVAMQAMNGLDQSASIGLCPTLGRSRSSRTPRGLARSSSTT